MDTARYYGCEFGAKSSTLATVIPKAVTTGRCEIRAESTVFRVETNTRGRATGVVYWDRAGKERRQSARAVVLAANGAETTRLLLLSTSPAFPHGLANSSGNVGRYIMFNGHASTFGRFEHPLNEYKGAVASRVVHDFYESDAKRGFYGGGGIDARFPYGPIMFAADRDCRPIVPAWGREYKRTLRDYYTHSVRFMAHLTSLPVATQHHLARSRAPGFVGTSRVAPNVPGPSGRHEGGALVPRSDAGADGSGRCDATSGECRFSRSDGGVHLLGTARMGNDPRDSVVDRYHRAHDVPNLFICDGSSFVTSGRGQPTMTIQALAFRAAEHIARLRAVARDLTRPWEEEGGLRKEGGGRRAEGGGRMAEKRRCHPERQRGIFSNVHRG